MDNFYLKYSKEMPYPLPSAKKLRDDYIIIWKNQILTELSILENIFLKKYSFYLNDNIIHLIEKIISLIQQYRYLFLEQYLYYLDNDDKFYININDNINIYKINFLKQEYNKILLLIDNICSCNTSLALIYQDKFFFYQNKNKLLFKDYKIEINNEEIFNKFASDINTIEKEFEEKKNIFNFKNNQNMLYPKSEELIKLFEEFNTNNLINNLEIQKKIEKCSNKVVKDKLLSKTNDIIIQQNNPEFDELLEISKIIQDIKIEVKDIIEKQKNYCASSMIDINYFKDEFNDIKTNNIKINNEVEGLKDEIKEYNNKYIHIIKEIDNSQNKYNKIKNINNDLNIKVNQFLKKYK